MFIHLLVYSLVRKVLEAQGVELHGKYVGREMLATAQTFHLQRPTVPLSNIFAWLVILQYSETGSSPTVKLHL